MKKIASFFALGALIASCSGNAGQGYEINGEYADSIMDKETLYLMDGDSIVDSTVVSGTTFAFKGVVDSAVAFRVAGAAMMRGQVRYNTLARVILDKDKKVTIKVTDRAVVSDNGGDNDVLMSFMEEFQNVNNANMETYQNMVANNTPQDSIMLFIEAHRAKIAQLWQDAVKKNVSNVAGAAIFSDFCYELDAAAFDSLSKNLKFAHVFPRIQQQKEVFAHLAATAEGQPFVDFAGKGLEGQPVKLSDYVGKGKYVLVDFWASWCGPCRREIPNLIQVNKQFKGDNFMVLGVDVWDQEDKFKAALEEEKVDYTQIFASETKDATTLYGIQGIPQIMLFGPDGTILKRGLRGDAIAETVKEYLKK